MQLIGTCQINKKEKKGSILIAIPLFPKSDLFVVENKKREKENSPDFIIFFSNVRVGAIWKNSFEKEGEIKNYLSGYIFTLFMPENNLKIVIFEDKLQKEGTWWSGSVFWSDEKKEIDQSSEIEENYSDDSTEEIF